MGDNQVELTLTGVPEAAAKARRALRALLEYVPQSLFDDLCLLVNELVTNSIRHAGTSDEGWIRLKAMVSPSTVRAEVADSGPGYVPQHPTPTPNQTSGRGLYLLDAIADRWGVSEDGTSRTWFEIDLPREDSLSSGRAPDHSPPTSR